MPRASLYEGAPRSLHADEWTARLLLHLTPEVGPARFHALLARFGSARAALAAPVRALRDVLGSWSVAERLGDPEGHGGRLEQARYAAAKGGMMVLLHADPGYPACLGRLSPRPPALWVRGTLPHLPGVAIVGTRRATGRACDLAATLAGQAVEKGLAVVSGGAYGVDAAAHRGALDATGATVVVLGGGLDRPYPERHIPLFEAAARNGAVVSPFPPGTPPVRGGFLARNAVIASLAEAVIVVEAPHRSGALGTARIARRLGLPLLAMPGSPGTDALLRDGAQPAMASCSGASAEDETALSLDAGERQVLVALTEIGVASAEGVAARASLEPLEALAALMALVVEGHVTQEPGGQFRPATRDVAELARKKEG